jgi:hypothetical protein
VGGLISASRRDGRDMTAAARQSFLSKFETQVDPTGILAPAERQRRALALRKAYFSRLALASATARAKTARRREATRGRLVTSDGR